MYSVINMGIPDTMLLLMALCITCSSTMIYQYQGHFIGFMIISKLHGFFMLLSTLWFCIEMSCWNFHGHFHWMKAEVDDSREERSGMGLVQRCVMKNAPQCFNRLKTIAEMGKRVTWGQIMIIRNFRSLEPIQSGTMTHIQGNTGVEQPSISA